MKKLVVVNQDACMACLACEQACSEAFYKTYNPDLACIHVIEKKDKIKTQTCISCGKCAKVCENGAISQNAKGVYMIDKKKCVKCGKCVEACPMKVMVITEEKVSKCIACGICAKACPMDVLEVVEK